jgi:exosortase
VTTNVRAETRRAIALPDVPAAVPLLAAAAAFALLFARPAASLAREWWVNPEAGHGLLLAPLAFWFAYKEGIRADAAPNRGLGLAMLLMAVFARYVSDLAAELFVMRSSMVLAAMALVVWYFGLRQLRHWWLPFTLFILSIPLPELVISAIALPLQFTASKIGAGLLDSRGIPVLLAGNVIRIPGHELFVAEACSGLRSLTALLSLSVLLGAITLNSPLSRILLVFIAIPVAIVLNGIRVFLTGFLVFFVDPKMGEGFMHITEGWMIFVVAFALLGVVAWGMMAIERRISGTPAPARAKRVEEPVEEEMEDEEYYDETDAEPEATEVRNG